MSRIVLLCALSLTIPALAKDRPMITIQVVSSQASVREFAYTTPATASKSVTNCDTSGTVNGDYVNAYTDCRTTTTPGAPAETHVTRIPQEHISVIMPNGDHVTLWCQEGFRRCDSLQPGSYEAEVKGDVAWVYTHELSGGVRKVKYHAVGGW